jgi:heparan-alpha-glucosaminide N-acetyltransferase
MTPNNPTPQRVTSVDALRGFVMLLMVAECLNLPKVAEQYPDEPVWQKVKFHTTHVGWEGCSLHDLIQPTFSFLVGAAAVFSLASRQARGEPFWKSLLHAVLRAAFLVAWGVVMRSFGTGRTNFTFEDTLSQIGLGYVPLFLIARAPSRWWWMFLAGILLCYWWAFALDGWFDGNYASGWAKNGNPAANFDRWFLNLFPRETAFSSNRGGYATLSFIPTLATMILGLFAGDWLRTAGRGGAVLVLGVAGVCGIGAGVLLDELGVCPIVKRIWTPSWVLFSGGWCFLLLAAFHALSDGIGYRGWTYPLRVIGANSILIYTLADSPLPAFVWTQAEKHLPAGAYSAFGDGWKPVVRGAVWMLLAWLLLWWLYRKRVFVRV